MTSAVFYRQHDVRVEEHKIPKIGAKDVLIQVKDCGTDLHIYERDKGRRRSKR